MLQGPSEKPGESKTPKSQSPTSTNNALGSSPELTTSTAAITTSAVDPMPSVLASTTTASVQVIQATDVTVSVQFTPSYRS